MRPLKDAGMVASLLGQRLSGTIVEFALPRFICP
jgi:hypothetical protein